MIELADDFKQRAEEKLSTAVSGTFFKSNNARLLPSFDRETDNDEFTLGAVLGEGAFCDVKEITAIADNDSNCNQTQPNTSSDDVDEADFPKVFQDKVEIRKYMSNNCMRKDQARYALKQIKPTDVKKQLEAALIDISIESKFLACLNHPNIIKMRGVAGTPLSPNFGIVLDRLYMTLEDRMDQWVAEKTKAISGGICGCLFASIDPVEGARLKLMAITVAYDLSCALRYIHSNNLVYRDIKPENAGFDVRGDVKLFDFGFCKELTKKLYDKASGAYKLTKMTGSPPYMAPENYLGKPYGKGADVFSFVVLLWEMLHHKFAFYHYNKADYKEIVVEKGYRPPINKSVPTRVQQIITQSWDQDPKKRPTFDRISVGLRAEYQDLLAESGSGGTGGLSRSEHLMRASIRSFRHRQKK